MVIRYLCNLKYREEYEYKNKIKIKLLGTVFGHGDYFWASASNGF